MMEQFGSEEVMNEYNPKFQKIIELITKDYSVIVFLKICVFVLDFQHIFDRVGNQWLLWVGLVVTKSVEIYNMTIWFDGVDFAVAERHLLACAVKLSAKESQPVEIDDSLPFEEENAFVAPLFMQDQHDRKICFSVLF